MTKPEWGLKRKCLKCGTFFYDMRKKEFSCPKCKEKYSLLSYEDAKTKQLQKLAKQAAPKLDDENLDEEALLQMTEDIPLNEEDLETNEDDILEDSDEGIAATSDLTGMVDGYDDENNDN